MKRTAGLWIDHRSAVIAIVSTQGDQTMVIRAGAASRQERRAGVCSTAPPYEAEQAQSARHCAWAFSARYDHYYEEVVSAIRGAVSIIIFGPGEAKKELKKCLDDVHLGGRVMVLETAERMTERQIASEIRAYFQ